MFVVKELVDLDLVYYLRYVKMVRCTCIIDNSRLMVNFLIWFFYLRYYLIISLCICSILSIFIYILYEFFRNVLI